MTIRVSKKYLKFVPLEVRLKLAVQFSGSGIQSPTSLSENSCCIEIHFCSQFVKKGKWVFGTLYLPNAGQTNCMLNFQLV